MSLVRFQHLQPARIAQLDRATAFEAVGWEFESLCGYQGHLAQSGQSTRLKPEVSLVRI